VSLSVAGNASLNTVTANTFLAGDGSAATPSIALSNDPDTGLYRYAGDFLGISTGGTARAYFNSSGLSLLSGGYMYVGGGSESNPSFAFTDDTNTGMYRVAADTLGFVTNEQTRLQVNNSVFNISNTVGLMANGSTGTTGQVLTSNGTATYWSTVSGGGFTNGSSISVADLTITGGLTANGSTGSSGQILASNGTSLYWTTQSSGSGAFVSRTYTGTGACTQFTVTDGVSNNSLLVMENGIVQTPSTDYSVSGTTLTFTAAPASSVNIQIRELAVVATLDSATSYAANNLTAVSTITVGNSTVNSVINSTSISANIGNFTGTVSYTLTGTSTTGGAQIYLNGATQNRIDFNTNGVAAPTYTTRSAGTKVALYPAISGSSVDYALGVDTGALWTSIPGNDAGQFFKWYGGETQVGSLSGTGMMNIIGAVNAASHTVGSNFIANSSQLTLTGIPLSANGSTGTAGQLLYSNGTTGSPYWAADNSSTAYSNATAYSSNATNISSGTISPARLPQANTTSNGAVIILDSVSNTSISIYAASANSVKTAYDAAINANTAASDAYTNATLYSSNATNISSGTLNTGRLPGTISISTAFSVGNSTVNTAITPVSIDTDGTLSVLGVATFSNTVQMSNNIIANVADPIDPRDAVNKQYVDTFIEGLHIHASVEAATTDTLAVITGGTVTYNNGTSGVGATLTLSVALTTLDGYSLLPGNRILVKNEANTAHNGIYERTSSTVLTRAQDTDSGVEIAGGDFTFVTNGTLYNNSGWVQTESVTTVGTDAILYTQFSGAGTYTAGNYLYLSGSQFNANATSSSTASVLIARDSEGNFAANTANLITLSSGVIGASSNGLIANSTIITVGNTSVNVAITTGGITSSGGSGVNPSSNTIGTALGTTSQRWVITANSITTSGSGTIGTTLDAGNTTIAGFANVTGTIQGGSSLTIAGAASGITTLAAGNTTITGFVNATSTVTSNTVSLRGSSGSFAATLNPTTLTASRTVTIPDETFTIGFRNIPPVGTKTSSYTLTTSDVGKYVQIGSGGSIVIPDATFTEGDAINIFNNTSGSITITCSITTAYIAGADTDVASVTLATRGMATILFISSTVCVIAGNIT